MADDLAAIAKAVALFGLGVKERARQQRAGIMRRTNRVSWRAQIYPCEKGEEKFCPQNML